MFIIICFISTLGISTTIIGHKTAVTILSQLKITKVNIIENFGKKNNRITSENARILNRKEKKKITFLLRIYLNGLPIVALTLKVSNKYN